MSTKIKKILIVEDEKPLSHALELKLTHCDFQVKSAGNGQEAMHFLENEQFDLVLLDLVMPLMDGFAFLAKLQEKKNPVQVIVLSNLSQEEDVKKAKELGAKDFFVKSNTPLIVIVDHIKKLLN